MRHFLLALAVFAASSPVLGAERRYTVTDFDRIQVDGAYRVTLATGRSSSARASGSQDAIDRVSIDVLGRTLRIRPNQSAWGGTADRRGAEPLTIMVTTRDLRSATINGAGLLSGDGVKAMRFDLGLSGSGQIAITNLQADTVFINLLGSGTIRVAGTTKNVRAEIHGAGNLDARELTASDAQVFADSAGDISLTATRAANVVASASGDVEIAGGAACSVKRTGSGYVRCQPK